MKTLIAFLIIFFCLTAHVVVLIGQDHIPFLISNGGDVQTDGNQTIHLAIGEPVVISSDGAQYIGLGFLQSLTRSEPCPVEDLDCLCARDPDNPQCIEVTLDNFNFLIDGAHQMIPPPTLQIDGPFHLSVFNRWGKQEFTTLGFEEIDIWDGVNQDGLLLENGVYFYVLENPGCQNGKCKGSITILR